MDNFEKLMLGIFSFGTGVYATEAVHRIIAEKATETAVYLVFAFIWAILTYYWSRQ